MKAHPFSISLYSNKNLSFNLQSSGMEKKQQHLIVSCPVSACTDQYMTLMLPPLSGVAGTFMPRGINSSP